jgi:hypothetical protein
MTGLNRRRILSIGGLGLAGKPQFATRKAMQNICVPMFASQPMLKPL